MTQVLDRYLLPRPERAPGERPARAALRDQVDRLERQLAGFVCDGFPMGVAADPVTRGGAGARVQTLAELERQRDALSARIGAIRRELDARGRVQEAARGRLEGIMLDPAAHPWERVTHADIGEPGCRQYHARPRLGFLGLLMDWWRVRISSGCPLCTHSDASRPSASTARRSRGSSWWAASACGSASRSSGSGLPGA